MSFPIEIPQSSQLGISEEAKLYHPTLARSLEAAFPNNLLPILRLEFPNRMPLHMVGEVGHPPADHALLAHWFNGDNWLHLMELALIGTALTANIDAGPNVKRSGGLFVFADGRQDQKSRTPMPGSSPHDENGEEVAIVQSESVMMLAFANTLKHVAGFDYVTTLDFHSHRAAEHLTSVGLEHLNLTTARLFGQEIIDKKLMNGNLETVTVAVDFGDISRAHFLSTFLKTELAIFRKWREPSEERNYP